MLMNAIGDALGGPLEFSDVRYGVKELTGMCDDAIWGKRGYTGQIEAWAMDRRLLDGFVHCRLADLLRWWLRRARPPPALLPLEQYGYNHAFGRDPDRSTHSSVSLRGNISESMIEWEQQMVRTKQTKAGTELQAAMVP